MTTLLKQRVVLIAAVCGLGLVASTVPVMAQCCGQRTATAAGKKDKVVAQTTCPVMGGKINKELYADVDGYRLYVCCQGCIETIKADPGKYIEAVKAKGETPAKTPKTASAKCNQRKGVEAQCPAKTSAGGDCVKTPKESSGCK